MSEEIFRASEEISVASRGAYAILTISREAKRNAMCRSARQGMMRAFEHLRGRFRAVIVTGTGSAFCAGIDLKERAADVKEGIQTAIQEWVDVTVAIRQHPAVFIAAVNGTALGGGVTLINVADLAIAAEHAEIGMPEMGFATYPGLAGPSTQLSLSRKRAAWMVLTTDRIRADVALQWGLINQCVPAAELMPQAEALAARIAKFDPIALAAAKQALDRIPASITDWRQAFAYGELTNAQIKVYRGESNPFTVALPSKTPTDG